MAGLCLYSLPSLLSPDHPSRAVQAREGVRTRTDLANTPSQPASPSAPGMTGTVNQLSIINNQSSCLTVDSSQAKDYKAYLAPLPKNRAEDGTPLRCAHTDTADGLSYPPILVLVLVLPLVAHKPPNGGFGLGRE
ncbi:hypothetical protein LX36DRAFT_664791 [Colletotrichum falcatum]|nr:hypothetical protein LX36DRAFT_664791 [Colletotrichum falcatum]